MRWTDATIAVIDTETTGPDPQTARVVEVGVALFRKGVQLGEPWSRLVNPGCPIPEGASEIHGILDEHVADAPRLPELLPELAAVLAQADVIAGYNILHYDDPVMRGELGDAWDALTDGRPILDVFVVVGHDRIGRYWKGKGRHRLGNVAERYQVSAPGAHRVGADVVMTGRLLYALREDIERADLPRDVWDLDAELRVLGREQRERMDAYRASLQQQQE